MRFTNLLKKLIAAVALTAVVFSSGVLLFACNRKKVTLDDIYKSTSSVGEFTRSELELTLPLGWEIYTSSVSNLGSDTGYIKSLNAFIIVKYEDATVTTDKSKVVSAMSLIKCDDDRIYYDNEEYGTGEKGVVFPGEKFGIIAMRIKGNLIACKFKNGTVGVFDINGKTVLSRTKIKIDAEGSIRSTSLDNIIKILDDNLIAVHATFDRSGVSGYTSIYRPKYNDDDIDQSGELVCRVANADNAISYVNGFDGKYVSVTGNKAGDYVYFIPDKADGAPKSMTATGNASLLSDDKSNYDSEITYLGGGKFFFNEVWTVNSTDEYDYYDGSKYWVMSRYFYTPDNNRLSKYTKNADKVFMNLTNNFYDSSKTGVDTSSYLNDGYTYASYGLFIEDDKTAYYDQFILDSNLNVVLSLTGNFGIEIADQTKDKVGVYDLIMTKTDGYYYIPLAPSEVKIYNSKGKLVGENDRTTVLRQELSNNVIVAAVEDPDDSDDALYVAFNIYGEEITNKDYKYTSLSAFRGSYTIGERYDEKKGGTVKVLIGEDGKEISQLSNGEEPFSDLAAYKIGCYIYTSTDTIEIDGVQMHPVGIKNFNPNVNKNVVMPANMRACTLYAPSTSPQDMFVFEQIGKKDNDFNFMYRVYRLV
ncbi:MAG: hypothetical protein NC037_03625 [Bacteroides sp.]|nr:hypothetical protein [Bacillota bacterium]MCM1393648.1 hypothetical protein [[Eubacterium] siraeum]MCM1455600.1 hypothetical protein [Bacteroides sp.]